MSAAFEWVDVPGGRARFNGLVRGADEAGHDTFAVDRLGRILYGEMVPSVKGDDVSVEVVSFGFTAPDAVAMPDVAVSFAPSDAEAIADCIRRLVGVVGARPSARDKPSVLRTSKYVRFTGIVIFRDGWIRIADVSPTAMT